MSARAVQSRKAADFSIVCKVNSLNIALKASLNLGNQWEYRFNEIFNQIFPYCAGFRVFSEIVRDCAALTELCGPAPAHPVRRPDPERKRCRFLCVCNEKHSYFFPGLRMPFHHQTAKNISTKKKTSKRFELSEQTRFQDNAVNRSVMHPALRL